MDLDLTENISFKIEGELGKYNSLPVESLIKIAQSFQDLVHTIARHHLETQGILDISNFNIELFDFKKSSAVPSFKLTPRYKQTLTDNVVQQRKLVSEKINGILNLSNNGDYLALQTLYPNASVRNAIVETTFNFLNSFGDSPVSVVKEESEGKFVPLYKFQKFNEETKKSLMTKVLKEKSKSETIKKTAFAKVEIITREGKKPHNKIEEVYTNTNKSLSYDPEILVVGNLIYTLRYPLRCKFEKEDDFYSIQSELIDLIGTGKSEDEAEKNFAQEFDFIYKRYNELADNQLSDRIKFIKSIINYLVLKVEVQ